MKPRHSSKTIWFSYALGVFGAIYANVSYIQPFIKPVYYGYGIMAIAVCINLLRSVTKQPLE